MSKAGPALLRTTLIRAADHARKQDLQRAKIHYTQVVERGAEHTTALCVVAAALAERARTVMRRGMPYVICDTDGTPVTPGRAKTIIAGGGPSPPRSAPAAATASTKPRERRRGRPLSKSSQDMNGQTHAASTNEATFPTADPHAGSPQHARPP